MLFFINLSPPVWHKPSIISSGIKTQETLVVISPKVSLNLSVDILNDYLKSDNLLIELLIEDSSTWSGESPECPEKLMKRVAVDYWSLQPVKKQLQWFPMHQWEWYAAYCPVQSRRFPSPQHWWQPLPDIIQMIKSGWKALALLLKRQNILSSDRIHGRWIWFPHWMPAYLKKPDPRLWIQDSGFDTQYADLKL